MADEESHKTEEQLLCGICGVDDFVEEDGDDHSSEMDDSLEEGEIRAWAEEPCRTNAAEDGRKVKEIGDPSRPTIAETEEHERSNHCSYRNWCGVCVRARGKCNGGTGAERILI